MTDVARRVPPAERTSADDALERTFARHQAELLGTLYYLVGNVEDARDALQEAFVKCWRHRDQVAEVVNLKAWVFRIALNTGRDLRQTAWRRRKRALPDDGSGLASRDGSMESELERGEQMAKLRQAIAELRPEEQEVFLLRQNGELTYDEIASALGIPTGTVKTRMRMALSKLREALA